MIIVLASIYVKPGKVQELLPILKDNVPDVRNEKGCIEYIPGADCDAGMPRQILEKDVVTILEKWESLDALRAHLGSTHMQVYREKVKNIVEKVTVKVLREV